LGKRLSLSEVAQGRRDDNPYEPYESSVVRNESAGAIGQGVVDCPP